MSNLTRFENDGLELVIETQTGEAYATQSGYARMSSLTQQAVNKRCKGYNQNEFKKAEIDLGYGLQGYNLIPAKLVYRWLTKDNPELSLAMGEVGATVYLHQLAGYKVTSEALAPKLPQTYLEALKAQQEALTALIESQERNQLLEAQVSQMEEEIERQSEVIDELFDYSSIIRIAKFNEVSEKSFNWRTLKAASKVLNLEVKHAPCPRYGVKNLYHHEVWKRAYPQLNFPECSALVHQ